LKHKYTERKT